MKSLKLFACLLYILIVVASAFVQDSMCAETESDPFEGVSENPTPHPSLTKTEHFFYDNFGFRKELMSQFGSSDVSSEHGHLSSRQSAGFEFLKKFSSETKTYAAFKFQGRLVRRDGFVGSLNDSEGVKLLGNFFEYHNAYIDLYNFLDPAFSEESQSSHIGRFNARMGRFYVPFGLNLQTDTHGPVLQLSNDRNFGFERDWYAGFWGTLSEDIRYDLYYMVGSGYDLKYRGQNGLAAARLSLTNKYLFDYGWEGGLSLIGGQRLTMENLPLETSRIGFDGRYRRAIPNGLLTWTSELSGGKDSSDGVLTQLHQLEYLHATRHFGFITQYRWLWQDLNNIYSKVDASLFLEGTWYFRNDVGNSNLHWIKLNNEIQTSHQKGVKAVIWTLQYYWYW